MPEPAPDLLTVPQAARRLGVSPNTLYRLFDNPERPDWALKIGAQWRISVPRLEQWLHGATA